MLQSLQLSTILIIQLVSALIFLSVEVKPFYYFAGGQTLEQKTIPVGLNPLRIDINPSTNMIYVTNYQSHSISVIDGSQDKLVANISDVLYPTDIYTDEKSNKIYVNHKAQVQDEGASQSQYSAIPTVSIINGSTNKIIGNVSGATEVKGVNPSRGEIYAVRAPDTSSLVILDEDTNSEKAEVNLGFYPTEIVINQNTNMIYIGSNESNTISKVNPSTFDVMSSKILLPDAPVSMAINPSTSILYAAYINTSALSSLPNVGAGQTLPRGAVSAIDESTDRQLASVPTVSPSALAVNTDANTIIVTNSFSGTISVIDGANNAIISEGIKVGNSPQDIVVNSNNDKAYISNSGSNSVTVVYP